MLLMLLFDKARLLVKVSLDGAEFGQLGVKNRLHALAVGERTSEGFEYRPWRTAAWTFVGSLLILKRRFSGSRHLTAWLTHTPWNPRDTR